MIEKLSINESNKWRYKLKSGTTLRDAISKEDNVGVLNALKQCYQEINQALPDWYDEDSLENDFEDIDNQLDNCENYEDYDMTYEDVEDEINYLLDKFYDMCDDLNIWVEL